MAGITRLFGVTGSAGGDRRLALRAVLADVEAVTYFELDKTTIADFVHDVWLPQRSEGLRPNTLAGYETVMTKWVLPA